MNAALLGAVLPVLNLISLACFLVVVQQRKKSLRDCARLIKKMDVLVAVKDTHIAALEQHVQILTDTITLLRGGSVM